MEVDLAQVKAIAVEDDLSGVALIGRMLMRLQIQAYIDPTGSHVVQMALSMQPHIIFMDLNLPGRSGFELIGDLRNQPSLRNTPVVAVSAMDAHIAVPRCKELGFQGYIAKPLRSAHLARQIRRVLSGETVWDTNFALI
jgi:CheY-like chemotaxis protein